MTLGGLQGYVGRPIYFYGKDINKMVVLVEATIFLILLVGGITQLVIPIINDRPIFPMFRKRKLTKTYTDTLDELDDIKNQQELEKLQEEILKSKTNQSKKEYKNEHI